jgi:molybdopterin/thiamine biosynthesis adenylyltransferase
VNFFFQRDDIGKKRSDVVANRLRELNPLCSISTADVLTNQALLASHSAIVITQHFPLADLISLNEFCRNSGISFFYCFTSSLHASLFVDHGPKHVVHDYDGERPIQKLITSIVPVEGNDGECLVR